MGVRRSDDVLLQSEAELSATCSSLISCSAVPHVDSPSIATIACRVVNHRFHHLPNLSCGSSGESRRHDDIHHEYDVARLLRETLPQKGPVPQAQC